MNERQYFDLKTLEQRYASAYAALPERYRKESLLLFFLDVNGNVWAEPGIGRMGNPTSLLKKMMVPNT